MDVILQQLVNALAIGSLYALIALGYTMVYGILRLINFAHGDVFMIGAFVGAYVAQALSLATGYPADSRQSFLLGVGSIFASVLISTAACGLVGYVIERFAYRPLRNSSRLAALITAIGISLLIENLANMEWHAGSFTFFGPNPTQYPKIEYFDQPVFTLLSDWTSQHLNFGLPNWLVHIRLILRDVLLLATTGATLLALQFIVMRTRMGKAMRAVSLNYDAAQLMGINLNRVISFTFILGSALAAIGGCLYGIQFNQVTPTMGIIFGLKAFVAAVIGGIGNIPGAAAGGLLLGLTETLASSFGASRYQDAIAFVILILVLLVKPEGIFGKGVPEKV